MNTRHMTAWLLAATVLASAAALADEPESPTGLVRRVSNDLLVSIQTDPAFHAGNLDRLKTLVDERVMPHVDMVRMTSLSMGRHWKQASVAQQGNLQAEFKTLLVRSYAGALSQVSSNQTIEVRPLRSGASEPEVIVSTLVRGQGEPIPIDYRLYHAGTDWMIYDVGIAGIWLAENYRNTFSQEVGASGIDGLIGKLQERNGTLRTAVVAK